MADKFSLNHILGADFLVKALETLEKDECDTSIIVIGVDDKTCKISISDNFENYFKLLGILEAIVFAIKEIQDLEGE